MATKRLNKPTKIFKLDGKRHASNAERGKDLFSKLAMYQKSPKLTSQLAQEIFNYTRLVNVLLVKLFARST